MKLTDPLDSLLQTWRPQPTTQPDFEAEVRERLSPQTSTRANGWLRFSAALPLAAALAIVAGTVAGTKIGQHREGEIMADAYARSIDPVLMMAPSQP